MSANQQNAQPQAQDALKPIIQGYLAQIEAYKLSLKEMMEGVINIRTSFNVTTSNYEELKMLHASQGKIIEQLSKQVKELTDENEALKNPPSVNKVKEVVNG